MEINDISPEEKSILVHDVLGKILNATNERKSVLEKSSINFDSMPLDDTSVGDQSLDSQNDAPLDESHSSLEEKLMEISAHHSDSNECLSESKTISDCTAGSENEHGLLDNSAQQMDWIGVRKECNVDLDIVNNNQVPPSVSMKNR